MDLDNAQRLKKFLNDFDTTDKDILDRYVDEWSYQKVDKKTIMTTAGQTERHLYYILNGACKSYYLNEGKEHIMFFGYEPSFCGVVESFLTQTPSRYYLETISDCEFLKIPYTVHQQYVEEHREIERLFRIISEKFLSGVIERHHELMAFSAKKRFMNFVSRSPHLFQVATQKDIASYLRIDATNFSKFMNSIGQ